MGNGYGSCERCPLPERPLILPFQAILRESLALESGELGAAYNFGYVFNALYQPGYGIHNPAYIKSVLSASINWLNAN